jgi:hypothetical protein
MRRFLPIASIGIALTAPLVFAPQAAAGTTTVSMTFAEPIIPGLVQGCPISPMDGLCGSGEVIPFGHATDTVVFGAGTCAGCDRRMINLANGSIVLDELFANPTCPVCGIPGRGQPAAGTVVDTVISGTGMFADASGTLSGHVHAAGTAGVSTFSGTITLVS